MTYPCGMRLRTGPTGRRAVHQARDLDCRRNRFGYRDGAASDAKGEENRELRRLYPQPLRLFHPGCRRRTPTTDVGAAGAVGLDAFTARFVGVELGEEPGTHALLGMRVTTNGMDNVGAEQGSQPDLADAP